MDGVFMNIPVNTFNLTAVTLSAYVYLWLVVIRERPLPATYLIIN